jgi:hypothetical protein
MSQFRSFRALAGSAASMTSYQRIERGKGGKER